MKTNFLGTTVLFCFFIAFAFVAPAARALEISVAPATAVSGKDVELSVVVDKASELAGIKLVMTYDQNPLTFKKASKTEGTGSMIHVANDKTPGKLIIVMAGAKGVSGEKLPVLNLLFAANPGLKLDTKTEIGLAEAELVGEKLDRVEFALKSGVLTIAKEKADKE